MRSFLDFVKTRTVFNPAAQDTQPEQTGYMVPVDQPQQIPQVDTSDAINSMAGLLGPTPAEREAQQQKLLKQKRNMIAWTGLFDGLRQLANLYTASQGANNMQFTDNPYQTIEQGYQSELKRQDANQHYANSYAKQMIDYKRQAESDQMKRDLQKAQLKWYDTRDEMARMKAENDRIKTEKYVELLDGRIAKINEETGQIIELTPYKVDTEKSKAEKNRNQGKSALVRANNSGKGANSSKQGKRESKVKLTFPK